MAKSTNNKQTPTPTGATPTITPTPPTNHSTMQTVGAFWLNRWTQAIVVFLVSCFIYGNTITHNYSVDDAIVITRNQFTRQGLKGMKGIWSEDTFVGFFGKQQQLVTGGRYRPFSVATFALEMAAFGDHPKDAQGNYLKDAQGDYIKDKDGNYLYDCSPHISHFINVILYGLLCMLIYFCILQLFNPQRDKDNLKAHFIAFAAALLYATHPVHTEAIANIKGRDEILVMLGSVMALHYAFKAAIANTSLQKIVAWVLAIAGFLIGIFSKESAIPFLAVIPAALYVFIPTMTLSRAAIYTSPFVLLTIAFWFGLRKPILYVDNSKDEMNKILEKLSEDMYRDHKKKTWFFWVGNEPTEIMNNPFLKLDRGMYKPFDDSERMGTILYTWAEYVRLLVFPYVLTNDYYPRHIPVQDEDATQGKFYIIPKMSDSVPFASLLLHAGLGIFGLLAVLRRSPIGFCILFYFATFSVISNLFFPIGTNMAERFMFMPSLAFSLACAIGLYYFVKKNNIQLAGILLFIIAGLYSARTFTRNFAWKNDFTLFTTDIEVSKNSAKLNNAVSGVLQDSLVRVSDEAIREKMLLKALGHSRKAITMHPTYNNAWLLYGNSNTMLGNIFAKKTKNSANANSLETSNYHKKALEYYDEAIKSYIEVKRLRPDHPDVAQNLGIVFRDKGKLLGEKMGDMNKALESLVRASELLPNDSEVMRYLGISYGMLGQHPQAIAAFERALQLAPNQAAIWYNLAVAYGAAGNIAKSQECLAKSKELDPNYNPNAPAN